MRLKRYSLSSPPIRVEEEAQRSLCRLTRLPSATRVHAGSVCLGSYPVATEGSGPKKGPSSRGCKRLVPKGGFQGGTCCPVLPRDRPSVKCYSSCASSDTSC